MRKLCFLSMMCILVGSVWAGEVLVPASVSCRTDILNPTTNRSDSSKLSIRSDASAAKSWIKFDIGAIDPSTIRAATLRLTLHEDEGDYYFKVSAVNDDYTTNIDWAERDITWNNAPANDTASWTDPDFAHATLMGTVDLTGNYLAGSQHFIDVTSALQTDTDGIVQFILHDSDSLINCATHDHAGTAVPLLAAQEYWPTLFITLPPAGADFPNPEDGAVVEASLSQLSWTNPDPNTPGTPITCDVYFGTDPNQAAMDSVTLAAGADSVSIDATYGSLTPDTTYYWLVDCHDPSRATELIPGEMWSFYVGQAPSVDAGPDQVVWLDPSEVTVSLDGTTSDDGTYSVLWKQVGNDPTEVTISPADVDDTSVTLTERGVYEFMLTANDGVLSSSDTVRIVVGDDACDASHLDSSAAYNPGDENQDCIVDLADFITLIADSWLNCTDTLTNCSNP